ncbi:YrzI family small protein [Bacillus massilinigeriensis]|nr:YrzI family small protein [Bacillus mediterraneensis]
MTLNIIFFTLTIKRKKATKEELVHEERVKEIFEAHRERQVSYMNNQL